MDGFYTPGQPTDVGSVPVTATGSTLPRKLSDRFADVVDLADFASCSGLSTTGTISAASPSLTLTSAIDFANGQGILVAHAGAMPSVQQPSGLGLSIVGATGSTTRAYRIASIDGTGGVGAAIAAVTTNTAPAILDGNNYVSLSWSAPGSGPAPACYAIWRSDSGGAYSFVAFANSTSFWDQGMAAEDLPFWLPATPPSAALAEWLVTTISSGAGTTTVTLAAAATTAATGVFVCHDDTVGAAAWVAAAAGKMATVPPGARVRTSGLLPTITADNTRIEAPGVTFMPALINAGALFQFAGTGLGASFTLAGDVPRGGKSVPLTNAAGLSVGQYLFLSWGAPGNTSQALPWTFTSRIERIDGNTVGLCDASPIAFGALTPVTLTIAGSSNAGDSFGVSFSGGAAFSASYTVQAGDSPTTVAQNLALAINNAGGNTVSIDAVNTLGVISLYIPSALSAVTVTPSAAHGGGGAGTITSGTGTLPSVNLWTPLSWCGARGFTITATNSVGGGAALLGIYGLHLAEADFADLRFRNFANGAGLYQVNGYDCRYRNLRGYRGSAGAPNFTSYSDLWWDSHTRLRIDDVGSLGALSFGINVQSCSLISVVGMSEAGAMTGRGIKIAATCGGSIANIDGGNSESIGVGVVVACRDLTLFGVRACGNRGLASNASGIWIESWVRGIRFFGVHAFGNAKNDIEISEASCTDLTFHGTSTTALTSIYNAGGATFYDVNGIALAAGSAGAGSSPISKGYTLGSTTLTLGGVTATVSGLSLSGTTLREITAIPGGGVIDSGGNVGVRGVASASTFQVFSPIATTGIAAFVTSDFVLTAAGSGLLISAGANSGNTYTVIGAFSAGFTAFNKLILQSAGGNVGIRNINPLAQLDVAGAIKTTVYTVATLPTVGIAGSRAAVSDANATTFGTTVSGGGSNNVPVYDNGTNWIIG